MEDKKVLSGVVGSLLERERYRIVIPGHKKPCIRTIWDKVTFKNRYEEAPEQVFIIKPCWAGTMYRIADRSQYLSEEIKGTRLADVGLNLILANMDHILYILAAAIENREEEPSPELQKLLRWNIKTEEIYAAFRATIDDEEMQSFLNTIVLARGTVKILNPETNPMDGSE